MKLTNKQWNNFIKSINNPPKANKALRELIKEVKRKR